MQFNVSFDTPRDELNVALERAFLVSVALPDRPWIGSDPLEELRGLATTAGARIVGGLCQRRQKINPGSYIGKGKLRGTAGAGPGHRRRRGHLRQRPVPRPGAQPGKGHRRQGARPQRADPRHLRHPGALDRGALAGGAGRSSNIRCPGCGRCGPTSGERAAASARAAPAKRSSKKTAGSSIRRIRDLKARLVEVQARKEREVRSRREEHTVSLVGYTNAGKSTLMNALTGAGVYVEDKLFSTLDTRTRQWHLQATGAGCCSATRSASSATCRTIWSRRFKATLEEDAAGPAAAARGRCQQPAGGGADQGGQQGAEGPGLRRQADAAGAEQDRPRQRSVVSAGAAGAAPAGGGGQRRDATGAGRSATTR